MLDPRDQVLEHDFDFVFSISSKNWNEERESFFGSKAFSIILRHIKKYLVEASANIVSSSFKFLTEGKLESN